MRSVSVIGIGETKMGRYPNLSLREMILKAGGQAIADSGLDKKDIQALYIGNFNSQVLCGQGHMGSLVSEVLGLGNIPTIRTEGACASGSLAFRMGLIAVMSGIYDVVLVGGVEKMTHQPTELVTEAIASAMDYDLEAMEGLTFPANFAMMANRYFYEYRDVKREMGLCAVNAHHNASLNPDAQMPKEITLEKVLSAPFIADPLSIFDCSLVTDGAAFVVLATTDIAKKISKHRIVEVVGSGHAGDTITLFTKKSITSFDATISAAKQAYDQARLTPSDIDFAEVHDCFTITQIINIEDLGFAERGHGADAVAEGITSIDGKRPINPSGGLKAKGHPIGATGISQIYEVVTQLRGNAGHRQVNKADVGLSHNLGGTAGTCLVHIFKGR
ncbi:thiolase domain-containing protein [Clostridium sp. JNZ J1-5]